MGNRDAEDTSANGVMVRAAAIVLMGFLTVLWFQGCLVPLAREEMRQEYQKQLGGPPR
jgi:hypothetical protein